MQDFKYNRNSLRQLERSLYRPLKVQFALEATGAVAPKQSGPKAMDDGKFLESLPVQTLLHLSESDYASITR